MPFHRLTWRVGAISRFMLVLCVFIKLLTERCSQLEFPVQERLIPVTDPLHIGAEIDLPAFVEPQDLGAHLPHLLE